MKPIASEDAIPVAEAIIADYALDSERPSALRRGRTVELQLAEAVIDFAMRLMRKAEECAFLQANKAVPQADGLARRWTVDHPDRPAGAAPRGPYKVGEPEDEDDSTTVLNSSGESMTADEIVALLNTHLPEETPTDGMLRAMLAAWFGRSYTHGIAEEVPEFVDRMKAVYAAALKVQAHSSPRGTLVGCQHNWIYVVNPTGQPYWQCEQCLAASSTDPTPSLLPQKSEQT